MLNITPFIWDADCWCRVKVVASTNSIPVYSDRPTQIMILFKVTPSVPVSPKLICHKRKRKIGCFYTELCIASQSSL